MNKTYQESQRFNQWWLFAIMAFSTYVVIAGAFWGSPFPFDKEYNPSGDAFPMILSVCLIVAVDLFFILAKLDTHIDSEAISLKFRPVLRRRYTWDEIEGVKHINYRFVGGWGIRILTAYGTVFNVRGHEGLQVILKNGRKFLIGTQNPERMMAYLQEHHPDKLMD